MSKFLVLFLLSLSAWGQFPPFIGGYGSTFVPSNFTKKCNIVTGANGGATFITSSPGQDCTGANLIVIVAACFNTNYDTFGTSVPTSSPTNTFHRVGTWFAQGNENISIWYAYNATVSNSMTFTTGECNYPSIGVSGWSGALPVDPLDVHNSNGVASNADITTGSVTPNFTNELVIAGVTAQFGASWTVDSGFSPINSLPSAGEAAQDASLVQTSIVTVNPKFTASGGAVEQAAAIATFRSR